MSDNEKQTGAINLSFINPEVDPEFSHRSSLTAPLLKDYDIIPDASTIPSLEQIKSTELLGNQQLATLLEACGGIHLVP